MPATPGAVSQLRGAVAAFAATSGVLDPPLSDVRLAVSEAVGNVVIHSYRNHVEPGLVDVDASVVEGELRVVVADRGDGFAPRHDSPGSGMGLPIIAAVADRFEIRSRAPLGTEVHLSFKL
jgi:anti-sigma regulatory factor (Ser/Thr protein kinase)